TPPRGWRGGSPPGAAGRWTPPPAWCSWPSPASARCPPCGGEQRLFRARRPAAGGREPREERMGSVAQRRIADSVDADGGQPGSGIRGGRRPRLGVISMPGVRRRSLGTALLADRQVIARRAAVLKPLVDAADGAVVRFSTGDEMFFDLRGSTAAADDGSCGRPG